MTRRPTALIAGLDPALLVDDRARVNAARVRAAMDDAVTSLGADGIQAQLCLFPEPGPPAVHALRAALDGATWDVVMVGAGVRLAPSLSPLLEQLVELVAGHPTRPRIAFNGTPEDMADAVRRCLSPLRGDAGGTQDMPAVAKASKSTLRRSSCS